MTKHKVILYMYQAVHGVIDTSFHKWLVSWSDITHKILFVNQPQIGSVYGTETWRLAGSLSLVSGLDMTRIAEPTLCHFLSIQYTQYKCIGYISQT